VPASPSFPLTLVTRHLRQSLRRARNFLTDGAMADGVADGEARFWGARPPARARPPSRMPSRMEPR
jgi:hypothetical protein